MSTYWTWSEIKSKVEMDLDLEEETFIQDDEMLGYGNEAVDEAEAEIHAIYEDYFLNKAYIALVSGTEDYSMPSDIYANKIRRIMYRGSGLVYTIERIKDWKKFEEYTDENVYQSSTRYKYMIYNPTAGAPKLVLSPPAKETSSTNVQIWYIRNANRFSVDADVCDIPEFVQFVIQYIKVRCYEKEGHPQMQEAIQILEAQRELMTSTLQQMVVDADNTLEPDFSTYEEHS